LNFSTAKDLVKISINTVTLLADTLLLQLY